MIISHHIEKNNFRVLLPKSTLDALTEHALIHYPKEFGGIILGIRKDKMWIIVDYAIPELYSNSEIHFERDPDSLNKYLEKIYKESNANIEYLGEWHSHTNGTVNYSLNDYKSMIEISKEADVIIKEPLLIILGISKETHKYQLYQTINKKLVPLNNIALI